MHNGLKTIAIIPAYNEERNIAKVISRVKQYVDDVIVCDDGSTDMTYAIVESLGVKVTRHAERRGKGEAFKTLSRELIKLNPDIIVTLDGDGQHDPGDIPMLLKPIEAGESDFVIGSRYVDGGKMDAALYRRVGLKVINFLYEKAAGLSVKDTQSGFRAFSQKAFGFLMQFEAKGYGLEGEQLVMASRNGIRTMEVPISVKYKSLGPTSKTPALIHGAELLSTLLGLILRDQHLKYLGLSGAVLTFLGFVSGYLLWISNLKIFFSIPIALLTVGSSLIGISLIHALITFLRLRRINEKLKRFNVKINNAN
jgi:glycosyltransferase involved in cell wall biosynthesis